MAPNTREDPADAVYERTFVVAAPITRAWLAFTDPQERDAWMANPHLDKFEPAEITIGAVEPLRRLSWSQRYAGLDGSYDTTVTFDEAPGGTRITIVRSGFGESEGWRHYAHNTARGWDEMIADLALYLETAVRGARHFSFRSGLGATMLQSAAGVRITSVVPGGFAARAGMQAGDLLLRLNGASVGCDVSADSRPARLLAAHGDECLDRHAAAPADRGSRVVGNARSPAGGRRQP
jgi:uncharacterized protein YndB with AHSA1/START domain